MRIVKTTLIAAATLVGVFAQAQTADEIVNKHFEAIGGKAKISGIKSLHMESSMSVMGQDAPMTTTLVNGKGYKNEVDFNGQKIIQVLTDKGGWTVNPMTGASEPQALPEDAYQAAKSELYIGGPLLDYASKGNKIELAGKEKVGAAEAFKLKVTGADSSVSTYFIDPATYYLVKVIKTTPMGEIESMYSNYKKTDYGYVIPYSMETTLPQGFSMTATVNKVEINKEIDPKIFDMPKQ